MKINPISMTNRSSKVKNTTKGTLDTDINVKRIPSHKEKIDTFINAYGEKEMKRLGVVECETCAKRVYKDGLKSKYHNVDRSVSGHILICPECGRTYDDKGIVNVTKLKIDDYESKSRMFEGLKVDKKI